STPINYTRTKLSCYFAYLSMSSVFCLPPLLFVTFRDMYGISYTLLGTLVLVNFCTQLSIDLIFSFFAKYFNIHKTVKVMPLLTSAGLFIYAIVPSLLPQYAYAGLLIGTVVFSIAAGLCEVLISPLIAALPSEHPKKDMSMLHSLYAWGVFTVVVISTIFLTLFGRENWMYLTVFLALFPLVASYLFATSPMPEMNISQDNHSGEVGKRNVGLALCMGCIFLGSAAENTMANWISSYMESTLQIPKSLGDIFGMALFAILLGSVRTLYAKYGRNISTVLLWGMIGSTACYLIIGLSENIIFSFLSCVLIGCFTSMLWPGTLILMEEKIPNPGVVAYALMAAGGDFGASVAPQLLGVIVDKVSVSDWAAQLSTTLALSTEQIGMKVGMLTAALFPLMGIFLLLFIKKYFAK
ncbi:MAG: MFS transporter, partial [Lachnospiraceae bacterium]|nr:MFS transporter [Lachnospiraceae bacterium]